MAENKRLSLQLKNLLLTGIVGWIASLYTLWHSAKVHAGVEMGESFCNMSEKINCDTVALSKYSSVLGIPVPVLGLVYFVIVILLAMRALKQHREAKMGELSQKLIFISALVGVGASLIFAAISMTQIGAFCLVCAIVYFLCFSLLYFAWQISAALRKSGAAKDSFSKASFFLFATLIGAQYLFHPLSEFAARSLQASVESLPPEMLEEVLRDFRSESIYEIPQQQSPSFGPPNAQVTVVEFSDFLCPHCAVNFENMPAALASFRNNVRIIYKNFPFDPACNAGGSHRGACYAAYVARCVFKKLGFTAFKEVQGALFAGHSGFTKEFAKERGLAVGMTDADLTACVESSETKQEIKDEIDLAQSLAVEGTPAIFVNGRNVKMATNPGVLKAIVNDLVK